MKACFKHLFCAVSAGWLENRQCCLTYMLPVMYLLLTISAPNTLQRQLTHKNLQAGVVLRRVATSRALILCLPRTDLGQSPPAREGESGRTKTSDSKPSCAGEMGLFLSVCFSFYPSQFQGCALPAVAVNGITHYRISYKICFSVTKVKITERRSSVPSHPVWGFAVLGWIRSLNFVGFIYNLCSFLPSMFPNDFFFFFKSLFNHLKSC